MKNGLFVFFATFFIFFGCDGAPPEITDVFTQVTVFKNLQTAQSEELLSLFLVISDEDGEDDLEAIYLLNDEQELFWKLDALNWEKTDRKGSRWIGSSSIQMQDGSSFPRGDYRIIAADQAGDRDEQKIRIDIPTMNLKDFLFSELSFNGKTVEVVNRDDNLKFLYFNSSDRFIDFVFPPKGTMTAENFPRINDLKTESGNKLYLYYFAADEGVGVLCGPYSRIFERLSE